MHFSFNTDVAHNYGRILPRRAPRAPQRNKLKKRENWCFSATQKFVEDAAIIMITSIHSLVPVSLGGAGGGWCHNYERHQ